MNYTEKSTYTHNGEVIEFNYSPTATYTEQVSFVDIVSKNVFVNGNYLLLLEDITFNFMLVKTFTDIKADCNRTETHYNFGDVILTEAITNGNEFLRSLTSSVNRQYPIIQNTKI